MSAGNMDREEGDMSAGYMDREEGEMSAGYMDREEGDMSAGNMDREEEGASADYMEAEASTGEKRGPHPLDNSSNDSGESTEPPVRKTSRKTEETNMDTAQGNEGTRDNSGDRKMQQENPSPSSISQKDTEKKVGIFHWDKDTGTLSLISRLASAIGDASVIPTFQFYESDWGIVEEFFPVIIVFPSEIPAAPDSSLRRFLDLSFQTHEPEDMIVVITDLEDPKSENRITDEWNARRYGRCPLLTLTKAEMDVIRTEDKAKVSVEEGMTRKVRRMMEILQVEKGSQSRTQLLRGKSVIGIFSREAESGYSWLREALTSDSSEVRPCCISNNGFSQFDQDVSQCKFGILYHSKNRGRINVTDVEGSLYNEELQHLSSRLGKEKVIVVIDDLDDSSNHEKSQILSHQPSIGKKAKDLFLISRQEKTSDYQRRLMVERKLEQLEDIVWKRKLADTPKAKSPKDREKEVPGHVSQGEDDGKPVPVSRSEEQKERPVEKSGGRDYTNEVEWKKYPSGVHGKKTEKTTQNKDSSEDGRQRNLKDSPSGPGVYSDPPESQKARNRKWSFFTSFFPGSSQENRDNRDDQGAGIMEGAHAPSSGHSVEFSVPHVSFPSFTRKCVGIFSRSSEIEYFWLKTLLESQDFRNQVQSVSSCYISNNGFSQFDQDVSRCKFGILYHSKNRGRINVTDVVDSLYDEELQHLSSRLGKKNVVVVIDDLGDASDTMKENILRSQPSIKTLARDLILVKSGSAEGKTSAAKDAFKHVL